MNLDFSLPFVHTLELYIYNMSKSFFKVLKKWTKIMNFNKNARKWGAPNIQLKFIYSEKASKFCEIFP